MAAYWGELQGSRGLTARAGTVNSGITCHVRSWDHGIRVTLSTVNGEECCEIVRTGGSHNENTKEVIARFKFTDKELLDKL